MPTEIKTDRLPALEALKQATARHKAANDRLAAALASSAKARANRRPIRPFVSAL